MKQIINGDKIEFYDEDENMVMYLDSIPSHYIWWFNSNKIITITEDSNLYKSLEMLMNQHYEFDDSSILKNYKDDTYLKWHSDCYYNPDDEWSVKSVSILNIKYENNKFKIWCEKPLDKIIERKNKFHTIGFSPLGNGSYSKNIESGLTLQDDFATFVYQELKDLNVKKLSKMI